MWTSQLEALRAAGHEPRALDLPGFGEEPLRPGRLSYVEFVAERVERPAAVVGCSFGGRCALELAVEHPELVERLVLVNASIPGWEWSAAVRASHEAEDEALERGDLAAAAEANMVWLAPGAGDDVRELVRTMVIRNFELVLPVHEEVEFVPVEPPVTERLGEIGVPALLVVGGEDVPDSAAIADVLEAGIPDTRRATIAVAAHLPSLERPDELNRLLLDFLSQSL